MRKKLFIAAAIIVLLLLSFWGWLRYRQYSSWDIPVHRDIKMVARINTDDLIKMFVKEYGFRFSKKMKKKSTSPSASENTGIYFPGNIFIYNISSRQSSTLFCTLPVYDLTDFKKYAAHRFHLQWKDSAGISVGANSSGNMSVACNDDHITFAFSRQKEEVVSVLIEILSGKNLLSGNKKLVATLKEQSTPVSGTNGSYTFTADLKGKSLLYRSLFDSTVSQYFTMEEHPVKESTSGKPLTTISLHMYPSANTFKTVYQVKEYSLVTDSVLKYYKGCVQLKIGPPVLRQDTITSYEYDDNFEKTEKKTITEVKVPSVSLDIASEPALLHYLVQQGFVNDKNNFNKNIFPLYNVEASHSGYTLHLTTNATGEETLKPRSQPGLFLAVDIVVPETLEALDIAFLKPYLQHLNRVQVKGKLNAARLAEINGSLDFDKDALNAIVDMIKGW